MLELIKYSNSKSIIEYFNLNLSQRVIVPSPTLADEFRDYFNKDIRIDTIAKLINDQAQTNDQKIIRKSELVIDFYSLAIQSNYQKNFKNVLALFDIFSELRSHTQNIEVLSEVLIDFTEEESNLFLNFLEHMAKNKIIDEVMAYANKEIWSEFTEQQLCLIGFEHFSPIQLDWLNELALCNDIRIFIPKYVYDHSNPVDWPHWITAEVKDLTNDETARYADVAYYRKNNFISTINSINKNRNKILATNSLNIDQIQVFNKEQARFQINVNYWEFFLSKFEEIFSQFEPGMNSNQVKQKINELIVEHFKNYQFLKILLLLDETFEKILVNLKTKFRWSEDFIDFFKEIITRDLPRLFCGSASQLPDSSEVNCLGNKFIYKEPAYIICDSSFSSINDQQSLLNFEIQSILAKIGPIKRSELQKLFFKAKLIHAINDDQSIILFDEDLMDKNSFWKNFNLEYFSNNNEQALLCGEKKELGQSTHRSILKKPKITYSNMQLYADCPQKFYFSKLNPIEINISTDIFSSPVLRGQLAHEFIQDYLEKNQIIDRTIIDEDLDQFLKKKLIVENFQLKDTFNELKIGVANGIMFINDLMNGIKGKFEIYFEKELINNDVREARADCIIRNDDCFIVVDFKRSENSIPNKNEIENFISFQSWYYMDLLNTDRVMFVYLCLENIDKSMVISDEFMHERYCFLKMNRLAVKEMKSAQSKFYEFINNLKKNYVSEKEFIANSKSVKICTFCQYRYKCSEKRNY